MQVIVLCNLYGNLVQENSVFLCNFIIIICLFNKRDTKYQKLEQLIARRGNSLAYTYVYVQILLIKRQLPYFLIQFLRKLFFFEFGNPKVTVHKGAETIQGRKLYEEIRYMVVFRVALLISMTPHRLPAMRPTWFFTMHLWPLKPQVSVFLIATKMSYRQQLSDSPYTRYRISSYSFHP